MNIVVKEYDSPCGTLMIGSYNNKLCLCDWQIEGHCSVVNKRLRSNFNTEFCNGTSLIIEMAIEQLNEYFSGTRKNFNIELLFAGTDFQKKVWKELLDIPYGKTISYREVAEKIGQPKGVRAVANAIGANAISIFLPCHRVIGSNKSLTGYAGGVEAKGKLLKIEGVILPVIA